MFYQNWAKWTDLFWKSLYFLTLLVSFNRHRWTSGYFFDNNFFLQQQNGSGRCKCLLGLVLMGAFSGPDGTFGQGTTGPPRRPLTPHPPLHLHPHPRARGKESVRFGTPGMHRGSRTDELACAKAKESCVDLCLVWLFFVLRYAI